MASGLDLRTTIRKRPLWLVWHPHQRLWNWSLVYVAEKVARPKALRRLLVGVLVGVDSMALAVSAVWRSIARVLRCPRTLARPSGRPTVLYVDCGTFTRGDQIRQMHTWFTGRYQLKTIAFEAGHEYYLKASQALADLPDVDLRQVALVGPEHAGSEVRLFKSTAGAGDSLFAARGEKFESVPARRLSDILTSEEGVDIRTMPVILRMNIEGSELYVIEDLLDAGLLGEIDGYYGMWDDLSKIDWELDDRFRQLLRDHHIRNFTFNARDKNHRLRRFAIRLDVDTAIRRAIACKAGRRGRA